MNISRCEQRVLHVLAQGNVDPTLGPFMAAMQATQSALAPAPPTEEAKAVNDALGGAAKAISEALRKRR